MQRRPARCVLNCYERSAIVTEMLKQLDWETNLELRRKKARLTMLHKMQCNLVAIDQQKYLEPAGRSSRLTHRLSYKVPASETNYHCGLYSFSPNTIRDWNSLPLIVVDDRGTIHKLFQSPAGQVIIMVISFLLLVITISEAADL